MVEDLGSANGTFINQNELIGPARLDPGDELLIGVTLMQARARAEVAAQPSALRAGAGSPRARAAGARLRQPGRDRRSAPGVQRATPGLRELDRFLDVRVRRKAQLAPLALLMLIALALCIYFATR